MPEMPKSWERMLQGAIGAEQQRFLEVPGGWEGVDWLKGLKNLGRAYLEEKIPALGEQKTYGTLEESLAALETGEIPTYEAILKLDALKALAKGARPLLQMARNAADPMLEAEIRTAVSGVMKGTARSSQSALDTIREVQWRGLKGKTQGLYRDEFEGPGRDIGLVQFDPRKADITTAYHEYGHGRQYSPGEAMVPYRETMLPEEEAAEYAKEISWMLRGKGTREQYMSEWYPKDPTEVAAEGLAKKMRAEGTGRYEELYPKVLGRALEQFESQFPKEAQQAWFKLMAKTR